MAVALVLVLPLRPAVAQEAEEILDEEEMAQFRLFGEAGYTYQGKADIDGGGDVEVNRFDLGIVGRTDLFEKLRWTNTFFSSSRPRPGRTGDRASLAVG